MCIRDSLKAMQRLLAANELGTNKLSEIRGVLQVVLMTTLVIEVVTFFALFPGLLSVNKGNVGRTLWESLFFAVTVSYTHLIDLETLESVLDGLKVENEAGEKVFAQALPGDRIAQAGVSAGLFKSISEARKTIKSGGVYVKDVYKRQIRYSSSVRMTPQLVAEPNGCSESHLDREIACRK